MGRSVHRKLFPALSSINQTQDCSDFCDTACPYNCYSFPDYYFPPPPPPPPPLSPTQDSSSSNHIPSYFIILASLFSVIFVLLSLYVIKAKCCADWYGRRHSIGSISGASDQEFLEENQVDHPIWFITTAGLQQSVINAITVCRYKRDEGLIEGTECSVCLNEFHEGETLRLLPKCNHAFHIPCIDTWLRSHINCPLCRSGIVSNNSVPLPPEAVVSNLGSMELNSSNSRMRQEIQTENPTNDGELSSNMAVIGNEVNRAGTGETQDFANDLVSKEHENVKVFNDETQIEMRSMSMDSRLAGSSCPGPGLANSCTTEFEENPPMFEAIRRSSVAKCLHITPVSMKRSFSCSGRIQSARGYRTQHISLPY